MANKDLVTKEITSISKLNDFLGSFQDENVVNNCIESITYDIKSQTVFIQMQELLKKETHKFEKLHWEDSTDEKIRKFSEGYREKFPELLDSFKEWKPVRENLIKILRSSSDSIDRNSAIVSTIRIVTSAADIFGTLARAGGKSASSWADFAMEHASTIGLLSLFMEMTISKKMLRDAKKAIKLDQEFFKKIAEWFKQTEELDSAVRSFFPYGIDADITRRITNSSSDFDDCNKIFMSIVASNVKKNVKLFKDEKFLDRANRFANSEAGKQWFHKLILEDDPNFSHYLNSKLNDEIQDILKISPTDNPELYVDGCRMLSSKVKMKAVLNAMTIISAGSNLLFGNKPEESDVMKELSEKTEKELKGIKSIVRFLKPSESELDDVLV